MNKQLKVFITLCLIIMLAAPSPTFAQSFMFNANDNEDLNYLKSIIGVIQTYYVEDVDTKDLIEGAYHGMFDVLDPHSVYLPPAEYVEFNNSIDGDFSGIGVHITKDGDYIGVIAPIEGTPAYNVGMKTGDIIVSVNGEEIKGWSMEKAIAQIRGKEGTSVVIGVRRSGVADILEFTIVRAEIDIKYVTYEMQKDIGYMEIEQFNNGVSKTVGEGIKFFENQGAKGMILDLRGNPGGSLAEAIEVSEYFLEKGEAIVFIDYRVQEDVEYLAQKGRTSLPVVVLIDEGSASASEIVTGAIQENNRGEVVGTTSYGKGTVQTLISLIDGAGIKITTAEYFSPMRNKINTIGITPDHMVENMKADPSTIEFAPMIEGGVFKVGQKGLDIYGAQQRLKFLGYKVSADGLFGEGTEIAIKSFQSNEAIEKNGLLDLKTKQKINERVRDYIITGAKDHQLEEAKKLILKEVTK